MKKTPRAKFIAEAGVDTKRLAACVWDAMQQASSHDPDHAGELDLLANLIQAEAKLQERRFRDVCARLSVLERNASLVIRQWNKSGRKS